MTASDMLTINDLFQAFIAVIWPFLQQKMKDSELAIFAWIGRYTKFVNIILPPIVGLITTLGFQWSWDGDWSSGRNFHLAIPPLSAIGHVVGSWVLSQITYWLAKSKIQKPDLPPAV